MLWSASGPCHPVGTERAYDAAVAYPLPAGVSALIHPDDEPIIAILEQCAEDRRRLGRAGARGDIAAERPRVRRASLAPAPRRQVMTRSTRFHLSASSKKLAEWYHAIA